MGIVKQLEVYKKKYYLNRAIKGMILWTAGVISFFLLVNTLEFAARLNELGRAILFFSFITGVGVSAYLLFIKYLWLRQTKTHDLSNEKVAKEIGHFFPEVSDRLLNLLQLESLNGQENALLKASIEQKTQQISHIPFANAISLQENKRYLRYVVPPAFAILLTLLFLPQLITKSTERIVNFDTAYIPEAPFSFELSDNELIGFKSEPYELKFKAVGNSIPENAFVEINGRKIKTKNKGNGSFSYTFDRLTTDVSFRLQGAGITSKPIMLRAVDRPFLESFMISLDYPSHTGIDAETIKNSGNITIPEGTKVNWRLQTKAVDQAYLLINDKPRSFKRDENVYSYDSAFKSSINYSLKLENQYSSNKDSLNFSIEVVKDQYPKIKLEQYQDTILYQEIVLAGQIVDDYGFKTLKLKYAYEGTEGFEEEIINIEPQLKDQTYYYVFKLDAKQVKAGGELRYYLEIKDNDQINGFKRSKTGTYLFKIPSTEEIANEIDQGNQQVANEINRTLNEAQELKNSIDEIDERLKTKKELDWRDEKLMQDVLKQKDKLSERLEQLKKENQQNNKKQQQFKPQSSDIEQKMQQLQEILESVLDDETRKLYEELRELLEEQSDIEEFRDKVEELKNNSQNLEEDIERTLELFKKLQFDMKLEENIKELDNAIEDQEALQEETESEEKTNEELAKEQEKEREEMEKLQEELNKLNELNQERKNPEALPEDLNDEIEDIQSEQQEAQDALEEKNNDQSENEGGEEQNQEQENKQKDNDQRQKASKAQQRATQKMKAMKQSLSSMQSAMQMEQQQENIDNLRGLVDNLVTLSFDQEALMNQFEDINQSDPRFVTLSQRQLKLQDDSKIVQDSLIALSQRVFQISSFVMKELNEMNAQMDATVEALKEKNIGQATGRQQFTMTSINNLALFLDDILQQMQEQMAAGMGNSKRNNKSQKNIPMSSLSELQKKLSEQIQDLKKSGKSGRALSEELAKLAAQQERLRNALENFETGLDGNKLGKQIDRLIEQMELNEMDLLNKNVSNETIERQREILTRMLDAQNAMEQRGEDDKREAQTAYDYDISIPESMIEYLKQKEKEIELLKTIPTKLTPYYKKETNKYFNKIKNKK